MWGAPNTPKFNGKTPSKLPQYLENIGLIGDAASLKSQKTKAAICYAALDEAEVWQTLPKATNNLANCDAFVLLSKRCSVDVRVLTGIVMLTSNIM